MVTGSACISEWDEERVVEAVAAEFGQDISKNFQGKDLFSLHLSV